ncbi:hypothetical protein [Xanthobacter agilis]|uniref:DUF3618 domain-containing protein n=1 Tax=Xanthobacter agilis TaxID=47492 RepID=A0ABU0LEH1_XANAG|nr:hypothetical protein [Xanthobacter agilis]MDQ0505542.1 hypothetical protein [Xanthobacter agilis]
MTDRTSIVDRLFALRADLAGKTGGAAAPSQATPDPAARRIEPDAAKEAGPPPALGTNAADIQAAGTWVKAHPLASVGLCLLAGVLVGGVWTRGRERGAGR